MFAIGLTRLKMVFEGKTVRCCWLGSLLLCFPALAEEGEYREEKVTCAATLVTVLLVLTVMCLSPQSGSLDSFQIIPFLHLILIYLFAFLLQRRFSCSAILRGRILTI